MVAQFVVGFLLWTVAELTLLLARGIISLYFISD